MKELLHQWTIFRKGRMRVNACSCCGELKLPTNSSRSCENNGVLNSPLVKAGYRLYESTSLNSSVA
jgi:hypothetical protein